MRWLHLSDIHFDPNNDGRSTRWLRDAIPEYIRKLKTPFDHLFITGDFRHAVHQKNQDMDTVAQESVDFIRKVAISAGIISGKDEADVTRIHIVPGNHDLDCLDNDERLSKIREDYDSNKGVFQKDDLEYLLSRFQFFQCVLRHLYPDWTDEPSPALFLHHHRAFDEFSLLCANTSITCGYKDAGGKLDDRGKIVIGNDELDRALGVIDEKNPNKPVIILAHHSPEFFAVDERRAIETIWNRHKNIKLYLCGDAHKIWFSDRKQVREITAGCLLHADGTEAVFYEGEFPDGRITAHRWEPNLPEPDWTPHHLLDDQLMRDITPRRPALIISQDSPVSATEFFREREALIDDITARLNSDSFVVLNGMGGIGKTEFCRKLFARTINNGWAGVEKVGWFNFATDIATTLYKKWKGLGEDAENISPDDYFMRVVAHIENHEKPGNILLFLDNVNQPPPQDIKLLESLRCKIILTTRLDTWDRKEPIPVPPLSMEECIALYRKHSKISSIDDGHIRDIITLAQRHTLTVELLAKTQKALGISPEAFLKLLQNQSFNLADIDETVSYDMREERMINHLAKVFDIANVVDEQLRVLRLFSLFPQDPLPVDPARQWLGLDNLNAVNSLVNKGWLSRQNRPDGGAAYSIHPVIARVIQHVDMPTFGESQGLINAIAAALQIENHEIFKTKLWVLPFAESIASAFDSEDAPESASLLHNLAYIYEASANYSLAMEWYQKALAIGEKVLGKEHPDIAITYNNIAGIYDHQGDYKKAMDRYQKALAISENVLGKEHPDTAITYNNIALVYDSQGDYEKAMEWNQKALAIKEKVLGKEHPDTATTYNNIAAVYYNQGEYAKALEWYLKSYRIMLSKLGQQHPNTKTIRDNMEHAYSKISNAQPFDKWLTEAMRRK